MTVNSVRKVASLDIDEIALGASVLTQPVIQAAVFLDEIEFEGNKDTIVTLPNIAPRPGEEDGEERKYLLTYSGVLAQQGVDNDLYSFSVWNTPEKLIGFGTATPEPEFVMKKKIPKEILKAMVDAYNCAAVDNRSATEWASQIYFDPKTNEYELYFPIQDPTGGFVNYSHDPDAVSGLRETKTLILEAHSHHTMFASFSGHDNNQETLPRLYMVVGNINHANYGYTLRAKVGDSIIPLKAHQVFSFTAEEEIDNTKSADLCKTFAEYTATYGVDLKSCLKKAPAAAAAYRSGTPVTGGYGHGHGYLGGRTTSHHTPHLGHGYARVYGNSASQIDGISADPLTLEELAYAKTALGEAAISGLTSTQISLIVELIESRTSSWDKTKVKELIPLLMGIKHMSTYSSRKDFVELANIIMGGGI